MKDRDPRRFRRTRATIAAGLTVALVATACTASAEETAAYHQASPTEITDVTTNIAVPSSLDLKPYPHAVYGKADENDADLDKVQVLKDGPLKIEIPKTTRRYNQARCATVAFTPGFKITALAEDEGTTGLINTTNTIIFCSEKHTRVVAEATPAETK
jgi:hypothetical protein